MMTREELEAFRLDIATQIEDSVVVDTPVDSKWKATMMFLLEGILTELEYMNDSRDTRPTGKHQDYKESEVKVGGTD